MGKGEDSRELRTKGVVAMVGVGVGDGMSSQTDVPGNHVVDGSRLDNHHENKFSFINFETGITITGLKL